MFLDQQRYPLNDGDYTLKLNIKDLNSSKEDINHEQALKIKTIKNGFSDVQLVESYTQTTEKNILSKGGYDLVPFISNLYNTANTNLSCYFGITPNQMKKYSFRQVSFLNQHKKWLTTLLRVKK